MWKIILIAILGGLVFIAAIIVSVIAIMMSGGD